MKFQDFCNSFRCVKLKPNANQCITDYVGDRVTLAAPAAALLMDWGHIAPVATAPECPGLSEPGSFKAELGTPKILIEQRTMSEEKVG